VSSLEYAAHRTGPPRATAIRPRSSVVEHFHGKEGVIGSIPIEGLRKPAGDGGFCVSGGKSPWAKICRWDLNGSTGLALSLCASGLAFATNLGSDNLVAGRSLVMSANEISPRALSVREREILDFLLGVEVVGIEALRA
jgi:hypothetical protein